MAICAFTGDCNMSQSYCHDDVARFSSIVSVQNQTETVAKVNDPLDCYEPTDLNVRYNPPDGLHIFNPHPLVL